jgi:hypothetical protein
VFLQEMLAALQAFAESSPQTNQTVLPTDQRRLLQDRDSREKTQLYTFEKAPDPVTTNPAGRVGAAG